MEDNNIWELENMESTHNDSEIDEFKTDDDEEDDEYPYPRYTRLSIQD